MTAHGAPLPGAGGTLEAVGPYRLMGRLGEGGMSVVHLALDPAGRAVALKLLKPHVAGDAEGRARFAREVRALRRVRGRHVAEVLDAAADAEHPYVVMRYVNGRALHDVVPAAGPLDLPALLRLGAGLADALLDVHAAGVVHRDLKPGNVLLEDGEPVVIDFGIARLADETRVTSTGLLVGTPGYLAPEVVLGHEAGPAADAHGWGTTVAYAATGRSPFGSGPLDAVLFRVTRAEADLAGVPAPLAPLVRACLDPDPARRPAPRELRARCRALLDAVPGSGAVPSPPAAPVVPVDAGGAGAAATAVVPADPGAATRVVRPGERPAGPVPPPARPAAPPTRVGAPPTSVAAPPTAVAAPPTAVAAGSPAVGPAALQPAAGGRGDVERAGAAAGPGAPVPAPPRHVRARQPQHQPLLALLLGLVVVLVATAAPWLGAALLVVLLVLLRVADSAALAHVRRRERRPDRRQGWRTALALPWHLLAGTWAALFHLPVPLAAGGVLGGAAALAAPAAGAGSAGRALQLGAAVAAAAVLALSWRGQRGQAVRRASSWSLDRVAGTPTSRALVVGAGVLLVAVLLLAAVPAGPAWWPGSAPGGLRAPVADVLPAVPDRLPGR
ncbi:serine/threonine-protein kinase [Vallicoccus soli]|uniref:Serine/threonine protein kinase n=1 Tax=Vallicoccus soli TaxID=2339232 RepID=A0A3A3YR79_9ACTN|nr:serine/threonine-protein kinase [Vallicoccus soli]RJK93815.1 serine/threonine protein kinase [Vallicoccus soli]